MNAVIKYLRKIFLKEKWVIVKTFTLEKYNHYYVHCYESSYGKRDLLIFYNKGIISQKDMRDNEIYHMRLLPWLSGRKDSEISSFETVAQDDTVNALRRM